jgi:cysteine/O-acetylserine efflux protein
MFSTPNISAKSDPVDIWQGAQFSEIHHQRIKLQLKYLYAHILNWSAKMPTDFLPALSFILISTFTPGPNNISSAAMGALHGCGNTLNYLVGITVGFLLVMFICAVASSWVLHLFPGIEPVLRYIGAAYTLYLAYGILKASYSFESAKPLGFANGFLLQLFNPKLIIYGLTLFSTYLAPISAHLIQLIVAVILLALISLCAIAVWAAFGSVIKRYMHHPRARVALNVGLSVFLVITALDLAHIL